MSQNESEKQPIRPDDDTDLDEELTEGEEPRGRSSRGAAYSSRSDGQSSGPMEVVVDHGIEKAMKVLKRKLIKEGLFKELKSRRYYEKPSERKKRKSKEARKKARKEEARQKKNSQLFA